MDFPFYIFFFFFVSLCFLFPTFFFVFYLLSHKNIFQSRRVAFLFSVNLSFNAMRHHLGIQFINDLTIMENIYHFLFLFIFFFSHLFFEILLWLNPLKLSRWLKKLWDFCRSYKQNVPHFRPFALARESFVRGKWKTVSYSIANQHVFLLYRKNQWEFYF